MVRRLLSIILFLATQSVLAQVEWTEGWYVGGGPSVTSVFVVEQFDFGEFSERGDTDSGFVLNGGYRISRHFAVEAGYIEGGSPEFQSRLENLSNPNGLFSVQAEQDTTAIAASAVAILPFFRRWEVYMKAGIAFWEASSAQVLTPFSGGTPIIRQVDDDDIDFMMAVGLGASFGNQWFSRLEYLAFRTDDELLALGPGREARFDLLSLELHRRFGSGK